jgi:hypothetical protein
MKLGKWIAKFVVIGVLAVVAFGLLTQFLWNWLVPELFAGPIISFWQALGLLLLSKLLFWGMSSGKGKWSSHRNHQWKQQWKERYTNLSPEDKEKFKQRFKEKWCAWEESPTRSTSETQQDITGTKS